MDWKASDAHLSNDSREVLVLMHYWFVIGRKEMVPKVLLRRYLHQDSELHLSRTQHLVLSLK
jgi:hypothetical protein